MGRRVRFLNAQHLLHSHRVRPCCAGMSASARAYETRAAANRTYAAVVDALREELDAQLACLLLALRVQAGCADADESRALQDALEIRNRVRARVMGLLDNA